MVYKSQMVWKEDAKTKRFVWNLVVKSRYVMLLYMTDLMLPRIKVQITDAGIIYQLLSVYGKSISI